MRLTKTVILILILLLFSFGAIIQTLFADDWPQVQKDPQHTGYSPETLGTNFKVAWTYPFQPDRVFPQAQAIIYQGKIFVGTEGANGRKPTLYAIDAVNPDPNSPAWARAGRVIWTFEAGGSILNSVAVDQGKVFFGAMDGAIYALDANNGNLIWKRQISTRYGFSTAPVIAENKVMLGGRNGYFYALDPSDGRILWSYNVGAPIFMTAAYDNGKAFFGAQDICVYALNSADGTLAWKTPRLHGTAFKDYWPVVYQGMVFIRPMADLISSGGISAGFPFAWYFYTGDNSVWTWLFNNSATLASGNAWQIPEFMSAQDQVMARYAANPNNYGRNLYILDADTGSETKVVPHWTSQTMNGATTPPSVDREGRLIVPVMFIGSGWARMDLDRERLVDVLFDGNDREGRPLATVNTVAAGFGNDDENNVVTCARNLVLAKHIDENPISANGSFNLDTRRWTYIPSGKRNSQMQHNTQGGGTNAYTVSNGLIYTIVHHELIARTTQ